MDYDSAPFEVRSDDPDFPATGLRKTSYIYDGESYTELPESALIRRAGKLDGDLLKRFRQSAGV